MATVKNLIPLYQIIVLKQGKILPEIKNPAFRKIKKSSLQAG